MQSSDRSISKIVEFSGFIIADFFNGVGFIFILRVGTDAPAKQVEPNFPHPSQPGVLPKR